MPGPAEQPDIELAFWSFLVPTLCPTYYLNNLCKIRGEKDSLLKEMSRNMTRTGAGWDHPNNNPLVLYTSGLESQNLSRPTTDSRSNSPRVGRCEKGLKKERVEKSEKRSRGSITGQLTQRGI